jgi:hypothetical protein
MTTKTKGASSDGVIVWLRAGNPGICAAVVRISDSVTMSIRERTYFS